MNKLFVVFLFLFSFGVSAQQQLQTEHQGTPQALKNALASVKQSGERITVLQYTRQNEWILVAGRSSWYSDASYFQGLKGRGTKGLREVLEPILRDSTKHVENISIGAEGNWIILLRGGSFLSSSGSHFQNIGLATKVSQIRQGGSRVVKVYLGPRKSWVLGDHLGRLYTKRLPIDLGRLIESIEESKLRLLDLNFRLRGDEEFHYVLTAGGHYWKSGRPGTPLWNSLAKLQKGGRMINKVALQSNGNFTIVSQHEWNPGLNDILSRIEKSVGKMDIWRRMRHHKVPGVSIALVRKGRVLDVRPYGWRRRDTWASVNNETLFSAASISKAVGSAGIMKAVEEEKIDLDRSVLEHIGENRSLTTTRQWYASLANDRQRSFVRDAPFHSLLNHTSGFGVHGIGLYDPSRPPSLKDIIMGYGDPNKVEPEWIPLTKWQYSGGAYSVAESIISQTYRERFSSFMKKKILVPAGMSNSTFKSLSTTSRLNYAYGHKNNQRLPYKVCPGKSAGGLFTNARDYGKFLSMLMNDGKAPHGRQVLESSSVRRMMTPAHAQSSALNSCVKNSDCSVSNDEKCYTGMCIKPIDNGSRHSGLGMQLHKTRLSNGLPATIRHGGRQEGSRSWFDANLRVDYGIVILTNGDCEWEATLSNDKKEERGGCELVKEIKNSFYKIVL